MCRSNNNTQVTRASAADATVIILPFVISPVVVVTALHPWIQQQQQTTTTDADVTMGNNMDFWDNYSDEDTLIYDTNNSNSRTASSENDGSFLLLPTTTTDDDEQERQLNVYRGLERPRDDEDWRMIFNHFTAGLALITATGMEFEFREWEDAWMMDTEYANDDDDNDDY